MLGVTCGKEIEWLTDWRLALRIITYNVQVFVG
jgi:hypothetical protein